MIHGVSTMLLADKDGLPVLFLQFDQLPDYSAIYTFSSRALVFRTLIGIF